MPRRRFANGDEKVLLIKVEFSDVDTDFSFLFFFIVMLSAPSINQKIIEKAGVSIFIFNLIEKFSINFLYDPINRIANALHSHKGYMNIIGRIVYNASIIFISLIAISAALLSAKSIFGEGNAGSLHNSQH